MVLTAAHIHLTVHLFNLSLLMFIYIHECSCKLLLAASSFFLQRGHLLLGYGLLGAWASRHMAWPGLHSQLAL